MAEKALAYSQGLSSVALRAETIGQMWAEIVAAHAGSDALVSRHQGIRWTYAQMDEQVERCARALIAEGVQKGDRVGIWAPNLAEWVVVQFATARVGAIMVNINPSYRAHELEFVLRQSGCTMLILAPGYRNADYRALLKAAEAPALTRSIVLGEGWEALLARAEEVSPEQLAERENSLDFDEAINIQYTSGTTGFPKGATLTHHNILNNGFFIGETLAYTPVDRVCLPVPFYHCFGMVLGNMAIITHGACIVIPGDGFISKEVLETVEAERCTALYGVPTMFITELASPEFEQTDFSSLRTGIMAGSPCPVDTMKRVQGDMHISEMTICYGMTETSPVSTQTRLDDPLEKRVGTVGPVHPHVEVKIIDPESGRTIRRGETGELCTRGYCVMLGYWEDEEATRDVIDAARWMHTGDLATMDDDGYLNIVGRIKDMIICGGENIYPREIEEFLYSHPQIVDVQVIGIPDPKFGEAICAWIIPRQGAELNAKAIKDFCRGEIARYKIPRYYRFVDSFPMTISGKVQKYKMRETEIAERGLTELKTA
ncbi:MAG TPA: AMP-binding protein [Gaiellaceae bacterium]